MKRWSTADGTKIVRVLGGRSNAYLVGSPRGNILVDTGKSNRREQLLNNIRANDPDDRGIDLLILTHTHFDHCHNAAFLKRTFGCRIILNKNEAPFAQSGFTPLPEGTNRATRLIVKLGKAIGSRRFGYEPFEADLVFDETLDLKEQGYNLKVVATPGHSPGSASLIVNDEIALVGDATFGILPWSVFPPYADEVNTLVKSWGKLLTSGCSLFLPGHGRAIRRDLLQKQADYYLGLIKHTITGN